MGCSETLWLPHAWKCSRPGWATWSGGRCPYPHQGGWNKMILKVLLSSNYFMVLWLSKDSGWVMCCSSSDLYMCETLLCECFEFWCETEDLPCIQLGFVPPCTAQPNFWLLLPASGFWNPDHSQSDRPHFLTRNQHKDPVPASSWDPWEDSDGLWQLRGDCAVGSGIISETLLFFRKGLCKL